MLLFFQRVKKRFRTAKWAIFFVFVVMLIWWIVADDLQLSTTKDLGKFVLFWCLGLFVLSSISSITISIEDTLKERRRSKMSPSEREDAEKAQKRKESSFGLLVQSVIYFSCGLFLKGGATHLLAKVFYRSFLLLGFMALISSVLVRINEWFERRNAE